MGTIATEDSTRGAAEDDGSGRRGGFLCSLTIEEIGDMAADLGILPSVLVRRLS